LLIGHGSALPFLLNMIRTTIIENAVGGPLDQAKGAVTGRGCVAEVSEGVGDVGWEEGGSGRRNYGSISWSRVVSVRRLVSGLGFRRRRCEWGICLLPS
jgi:hypothetical protein